jgi:uncharacterized membrane protein YidH (DUF202 family)
MGNFGQKSSVFSSITGGEIDWGALVMQIATILIAIGTIVALIYIILSGLRIMTSEGNQTKLDTNRNRLLYVAVGLVVVAGAYVAWNFVLGFIGMEQIDMGF